MLSEGDRLHRIRVGTIAMALDDLSNDVLAAANNTIQGFGHCSRGCIAYQPLFDASLINTEGQPVDPDALKDALAFTVNERVDAGTFT